MSTNKTKLPGMPDELYFDGYQMGINPNLSQSEIRAFQDRQLGITPKKKSKWLLVHKEKYNVFSAASFTIETKNIDFIEVKAYKKRK